MYGYTCAHCINGCTLPAQTLMRKEFGTISVSNEPYDGDNIALRAGRPDYGHQREGTMQSKHTPYLYLCKNPSLNSRMQSPRVITRGKPATADQSHSATT